MIPSLIIMGCLSIVLTVSAAEDASDVDNKFDTYQDFSQEEIDHNDPHAETVSSGSPDAPASWTASSHEPPQDTPFRGNWFKKRALLQEMRVSQEALHKMVEEVWIPDHKKFQEIYEPALEQMKAIEHNLGFSQQTVTEIEGQLATLSTTTTGTQVPSQVMPSATFDKEAALHLLKEMREALETLGVIGNNAERAFRQAQQQEPMGTNFDQEAWKFYEEIDSAYDDHQAERLYKQIQSSEEYLKKLHIYLMNELAPYLNYLVGQCDATSHHIETVYNALFKQGIILRKADVPAARPVPAPVAPQPSWWQRIVGWLVAPFYAIGRWFKSLFGMK